MASKAQKKRRRAQREQERLKSAAVSAADCDRAGDSMQSDLLQDPKTLSADIRLIKANLPHQTQERLGEIMGRLQKVWSRETVDIVTKDGAVFPCGDTADKNAMKAIALEVTIAGLNQKEAHFQQRQMNPHAVRGTTVNVGVNVDNRSDERRARTLAIAERFGTGRVLSGDRAGSDGSDNPETGSVSVIKKVP